MLNFFMLTEPPIISAQQMAEFMMKCHTLSYRRANLSHIERVNGKAYADSVRLIMTEMSRKKDKK